eukprot:scaffold1663_cov171-Amphora_coffeaeformis.AAC.10
MKLGSIFHCLRTSMGYPTKKPSSRYGCGFSQKSFKPLFLTTLAQGDLTVSFVERARKASHFFALDQKHPLGYYGIPVISASSFPDTSGYMLNE